MLLSSLKMKTLSRLKQSPEDETFKRFLFSFIMFSFPMKILQQEIRIVFKHAGIVDINNKPLLSAISCESKNLSG